MNGAGNSGRRYLIVNGDDFGQSAGINRGVIKAYERGILTSASLMVQRPAAPAAAAYSRAHSDLSVGLHVDLGAWKYDAVGGWVPQYHVADIDDPAAVAHAFARQFDMFRALTGKDPTHLDSHQHVHNREPARSILLQAARSLGIPLRSCTPGITYCGRFYGQTGKGAPLPEAISVQALLGILLSLTPGVTELGCHPATGSNIDDTVYCLERVQELNVLCDPRIRRLLEAEGIKLRSYQGIGNSCWESSYD